MSIFKVWTIRKTNKVLKVKILNAARCQQLSSEQNSITSNNVCFYIATTAPIMYQTLVCD